MAPLAINLAKHDQERLTRLALRYGLSLPELSRRILTEVISDFPAESFSDYESPKALKASYRRALHDWPPAKRLPLIPQPTLSIYLRLEDKPRCRGKEQR